MSKVEEFIISHASSRYDPVKAHEYYLRTRELQGRRSSSDLKSDKKKQAWAFTKSEVQKEKKGALSDASESNKEAVEKLREKAEERRDEIREKLREVISRIVNEATNSRDQLSVSVKSKIEALPEAPEGLNKQQRAEFNAKRREEIAKIRGESQMNRKDIAANSKSRRTEEQGSVVDKRVQLATELQTTLDGARQAYKMAKEQVKSKYKSELDKEFESIRTNK